MKSISQIDYIGSELELFKLATNWKKYFAKKLIPFIKGDVLEVGAGIGINTQYLAVNTHLISSWWFLEPDPLLATQIELNTSQVNIANKKVINGVITDINDKTFDTIIYIDVLEHIKESSEEIKKIKLRLNPNGHLIILVPAYNFLYSNFDKKIGHYRRYNKSILASEINNSLKTVSLFYLDSMGFFASLANKLFLRKELPNTANIIFWDKYLIRMSMFFDIISIHSFGKSLIGIFKNEH